MLDIFETYFICDSMFQKEISKNFAKSEKNQRNRLVCLSKGRKPVRSRVLKSGNLTKSRKFYQILDWGKKRGKKHCRDENPENLKSENLGSVVLFFFFLKRGSHARLSEKRR